MITRDDWNDALDAWADEERARLGGLPSRDEVTAYLRGELPPGEAARVRALLVYDPELTPLLNAHTAKPHKTHAPQPRKRRALQLYAVAATVAIALLSADAVRQRARNTPAVPSSYELTASLERSAAAPAHEVPAGEARYLLTLVPPAPLAVGEYELAISRQSRVLWSARGVRPIGGRFVVDVPGTFLEPGTYTLDIRQGTLLIARYTLHVVTR